MFGYILGKCFAVYFSIDFINFYNKKSNFSIIDIFAVPGFILLFAGTILSCVIGNSFKGYKDAIGLVIAENGKFTSKKDVKTGIVLYKILR